MDRIPATRCTLSGIVASRVMMPLRVVLHRHRGKAGEEDPDDEEDSDEFHESKDLIPFSD